MRSTHRSIVIGALGAILVVGGAISAAAATTPQAAPTGVVPSQTTVAPTAPTATTNPTATPTATPTAPPTATPKPTEAPTEQQIKDLFKQWNDALATRDPKKVADRYAPDAVLLPTVSNKVRTDRDGIIDYFTHFLESRPSGTIKESKIKILGPTAAIDTGVYVFTLTKDGVESKVEARYTFVYELRDGKWLIVNHHSSAMPEK
ncbi:DUF4440 domain-containing protein [Micromonospora craterilacus]|uniref:DUF4440 domain-containing protein n=1 Tax=Micromonospora craterilacus TaxID=1655439 RepID=A0A2W2E573_9ACTN|nr:SgcJ/EcaC family oxidoreductase [Micromonospora craterilacus]PZG12355.1 DUF4440 domain-containing protein [Micromonospora craterilacus]